MKRILSIAALSIAAFVASISSDAQVINPSQPATGVPVAGTGIAVAGQTVSVNYGVANSPFAGNMSVGGTFAVTGAVSGTGFSNLFAIPYPIGGTTPNTAAFTTLSTTGLATLASETVTGTTTNSGATIMNGAISGTGVTSLFASPPVIGSTTPAAATFTTSISTTSNIGGISLGVVGAAFNGTTDDAAAINTALTSFNTVDCQGKIAKISSSVTVPAGKTLTNCNLVLGTAGMNGVLVNTGSKLLYDKITGTGTVSIVERGVYPATDAVTDVQLNVEVTNMTFGVQAQNVGTYTPANYPKRWTGYVYAHNIVGTTGASEGYGLLLSPALDCNLKVEAATIARHAIYLSAGAKGNFIDANIDGDQNYAVQLFSTNVQDATQYNTLRIKARNLAPNVVGNGAAIAIVQNANYNTVVLDVEGNGLATYAASIQGSSGGPYPKGNKIVDSSITGQFIGSDVINTSNADSTIVARNKIDAYAVNAVIAARTAGTNGSTHGIYVYDNSINGQAQNVIGVYDEDTAQASFIGTNDIANNGTSNRVTDNTSGQRSGYSRRALFSGTTASIPTVNSGDTTVTLSQALQLSGRNGMANLGSSSGTFFNAPFWAAIIGAGSATTATLRVYNGAGSAQTFTYNGWLDGD